MKLTTIDNTVPLDPHTRRVRGELMKLKAAASTTPLQEWLDTALGIIEREKVREGERVKEKMYLAGGDRRRA